MLWFCFRTLLLRPLWVSVTTDLRVFCCLGDPVSGNVSIGHLLCCYSLSNHFLGMKLYIIKRAFLCNIFVLTSSVEQNSSFNAPLLCYLSMCACAHARTHTHTHTHTHTPNCVNLSLIAEINANTKIDEPEKTTNNPPPKKNNKNI